MKYLKNIHWSLLKRRVTIKITMKILICVLAVGLVCAFAKPAQARIVACEEAIELHEPCVNTTVVVENNLICHKGIFVTNLSTCELNIKATPKIEISITGDGLPGGYGFYVEGGTGPVNISGFSVSGQEKAVVFEQARNVTLSYMDIQNSGTGLYMHSAIDIEVNSSIIDNNQDYTIWFDCSGKCLVYNNILGNKPSGNEGSEVLNITPTMELGPSKVNTKWQGGNNYPKRAELVRKRVGYDGSFEASSHEWVSGAVDDYPLAVDKAHYCDNDYSPTTTDRVVHMLTADVGNKFQGCANFFALAMSEDVAGDVTLDCGGFTIFGSPTFRETRATGIIVDTYKLGSIVIRNCIFTQFTTGIQVADGDHVTIHDNVLDEDMSYAALLLQGADDLTIRDNRLFGAEDMTILNESTSLPNTLIYNNYIDGDIDQSSMLVYPMWNVAVPYAGDNYVGGSTIGGNFYPAVGLVCPASPVNADFCADPHQIGDTGGEIQNWDYFPLRIRSEPPPHGRKGRRAKG